MIPLGDASRRPLRFPIVTALLIVANTLVFLMELPGWDTFINRWSLVPANVLAGQNWSTILAAMFMHARWAHILGNMLFWVFGPEIEAVMGPLRYLVFYLLSGLAATVAQILIDPTSIVPNLGTGRAIAGVMGAFLITYPCDRIRTILFIGSFARITFIPAIVLVGFWCLTQLFNEIGALAQVQSGGVAYMAHVGGFISGTITARFFESRKYRYQQGLDQI